MALVGLLYQSGVKKKKKEGREREREREERSEEERKGEIEELSTLIPVFYKRRKQKTIRIIVSKVCLQQNKM